MRKTNQDYERETGQSLTNWQPPSNFVSGREPHALTDTDRGVLGSALGAAGDMMTHRQQTHHAHSDDSALSIAFASIVASSPQWLFSALITGALLLLAWWILGDSEDGDLWLMGWLVIWGTTALYFFGRTHARTLHHSPSGIAHHEIDSRETVALHAIDKHCELIEKRLGLADDGEVIDVKPKRRLLG